VPVDFRPLFSRCSSRTRALPILYLPKAKALKMSASKIDFVNDITRSNKVAVFSKVYCPYCTMAKSALKEAGLKEYFLMELDEVDDGAAIQDALQKVTGARTVGFI